MAQLENLPSGLGSEAKKRRELLEKGSNRDPLVSGTFISTTGTNIAYPYVGEDDLYNKLNVALNNYTPTANQINALVQGAESTDAVQGDANTIEIDADVFDMTDRRILHLTPVLTNTGSVSIITQLGTKLVKKFDLTLDDYVILEEGDIQKYAPIALVWDETLDFFILAPKAVSDATPILGRTLTVTGSIVIDKTTPVQVVASAYDTSGNGGRKMVRLDSGRIVSTALNANILQIYKSDDNGDTWVALCTVNNVGNPLVYWAISTDGVNVTVLYGVSSATFKAVSFNGDTQINENIQPNGTIVESAQTTLGDCSLVRDSNGDLHATWASKNATYPNSFNIRYSKSTDGGVTWDAPTQVTTANTADNNNNNPYITINALGNPVIVYDFKQLTFYFVYSAVFNGSTWSAFNSVQPAIAHLQSNPSADTLSDGTIIVAWMGKDATDPTQNNIRFSQSTDDGVTWSTMEKLTSGNVIQHQRPSITRNSDNKIFMLFSTTESSSVEVSLIEGVSGAFNPYVEITAQSMNNFPHPSTVNNYRDFTKPISVWTDHTASDVKFYGKWTEFTKIQTVLNGSVKTGNFVYCNEPTELFLTLGGTQLIPSVDTAVSEAEITASGSGQLKTVGTLDKQFIGNLNKKSLGFSPL